MALVGCGGSAEHWTRVGDRHLRSNDLVEAELAYNRALDRDPTHAPAIYGKGWALYTSGYDTLVDPARQLFQRAIDYEPDYFGGYRGRGVLLLEEGKVLPAERMLREAYDRAPDEPTVLESLGQLYLLAGRLDEAELMFQGAVDLAPNRGELRYFLADVARRRGDFDAALEQIELGRSGNVSGNPGLLLLEEGEVMIQSDITEWRIEAASGPSDPALQDALQALNRADTVLLEASRRGLPAEARSLRRERLDSLERRLQAALEPTAPNNGGLEHR